MKTRSLFLIMLMASITFIAGCEDKKQPAKEPQTKTVTVTSDVFSTPLYFSGTISPLSVRNVTSPIDGIIETQNFHFGQIITNKSFLFELTSESLEKDYHSAISDYLKSQDDYNEKMRKFNGSEELHRLKFISENDYYADQVAKEESYRSLIQSRYHLQQTLDKLGLKDSYEDFNPSNPERRDDINEALLEKQDKITVMAPASGIALYPESSSSSSDSSDTIHLGSEIKQGQVLVSIGDLTGVTLKIQVSEIDINQIKVGQRATITGPAFPGITLNGHVTALDAQAKTGGSSLPTFPVTITVPSLTDEERQTIHVGMSAKIKIIMDDAKALLIPIRAVTQKEGQSYVTLKDKETGDEKSIPVTTGKTTQDNVVVTEGLHPGDQLVYRY